MSRAPKILGLTKDGSIIGPDGKILFFSLERFKREIVEGDCCFICGCSSDKHAFNDEHVIPDWLLREFDLQNKEISLPNRAGLKYSKYKVPCCAGCNSLLGQVLEVPVSKLLKGGYEAIYQHVKRDGPWLLYLWLSYAASLISTKPKFFTTLKDGFPVIAAKTPKFVKTEEGDGKRLGAIMYHLCGSELKKWDVANKEHILENLKLGKWTFTFDERGAFMSDSMDKI